MPDALSARLYFSVLLKHLRIPAAGEHGAGEDTTDRVYFSLEACVPSEIVCNTRRSLIYDTQRELVIVYTLVIVGTYRWYNVPLSPTGDICCVAR